MPAHPLREFGDKVIKYTRLLDVPWDYERIYNDHNAWIQRLVSQQDRLLVFNVKEGWEPLCKFLGNDVPSTTFPRLNDSKSFNRSLSQFRREKMKEVLLKAVLFSGRITSARKESP